MPDYPSEATRRQQVADSLRRMLTVLNSGQPLEAILDHIMAEACSLLDAEDNDYRVDPRRGRIVYGANGTQPWPSGVQNIRVIYSGGMFSAQGAPASGWTTQDEVDTIKRAMMLQAGYEWRNRQTLGIEQLNMQGLGKKTKAELLPEVKDALLPYRRM